MVIAVHIGAPRAFRDPFVGIKNILWEGLKGGA